MAMQEELNNFTRNEVWHLVPRPNQNVIGTKWVFRNKQDEHGVETYAPVARLEPIRILLSYATYHGFKLYQMDVKSAFLNDPIKKRYMLSNLSALKIVSILHMFISSQRHFIGSSKPQELMASKLVKLTLLSSLKLLLKTCLYANLC
jgi:hypothetical protein